MKSILSGYIQRKQQGGVISNFDSVYDYKKEGDTWKASKRGANKWFTITDEYSPAIEKLNAFEAGGFKHTDDVTAKIKELEKRGGGANDTPKGKVEEAKEKAKTTTEEPVGGAKTRLTEMQEAMEESKYERALYREVSNGGLDYAGSEDPYNRGKKYDEDLAKVDANRAKYQAEVEAKYDPANRKVALDRHVTELTAKSKEGNVSDKGDVLPISEYSKRYNKIVAPHYDIEGDMEARYKLSKSVYEEYMDKGARNNPLSKKDYLLLKSISKPFEDRYPVWSDFPYKNEPSTSKSTPKSEYEGVALKALREKTKSSNQTKEIPNPLPLLKELMNKVPDIRRDNSNESRSPVLDVSDKGKPKAIEPKQDAKLKNPIHRPMGGTPITDKFSVRNNPNTVADSSDFKSRYNSIVQPWYSLGDEPTQTYTIASQQAAANLRYLKGLEAGTEKGTFTEEDFRIMQAYSPSFERKYPTWSKFPYKAESKQQGGTLSQPNQEEQEEFKLWVGDMVQAGHIKEENLTEEAMPQLFQAYRDMKKKGKWKRKNKPSIMGVMRKGGKLSAYMPQGSMHRYNHKSESLIKSRYGVDVTKKGIPVLSKDCESGTCSYRQIAEIEGKEVIFDKPLVDKIMGFKDNPTKAGEIIYNALKGIE
jgi:hypothetical protein